MYAAQHRAVCGPERIAIIEASTKAGKTVGCLLWILMRTWNRGRPGYNAWWVAPIYASAEALGFRRLSLMLTEMDATKQVWRANESKLFIELANGGRIWFKGADKPDSLYGEDVFDAVIDEGTRVKESAWHAVRSTLTQTRGTVRIIGNVKGRKNWVYKLGRSGDPDVRLHKITAYDAADAGIFPREEIESAKRQLPYPVFQELYLAQAADATGGIFYAFDFNSNVRPVVYRPEAPIIVGSDFNVNPMAWVLGHWLGDRLEIFGELFLHNSNTRKTLDVLWDRYSHHQGGWKFFGDASGKARHSSASFSDYQQICDDARFQRAGRTVHYLSANPPRKDRFESCNALFCSADQLTRRLFIDPSCENLIRDLEYREYKPGTNEPDDQGDMGHISDALGYIVWNLAPLRLTVAPKPQPIIIRPGPKW